jgi:hypothetical protein
LLYTAMESSRRKALCYYFVRRKAAPGVFPEGSAHRTEGFCFMDEDKKRYIIKHRPLGEIIASGDPSQLEEFLGNPLPAIAEAVTGLCVSGSPLVLATGAAGRIMQGALKGEMYHQVGQEIKALRDAGKVKGPTESKNGWNSWIDLFRVIDEETPDPERFDAIKAMFIAANAVGIDDSASIAEYQLLQVAKRLNSGELLVLKTVWRLGRDGQIPSLPHDSSGGDWTRLNSWLTLVAANLGRLPVSLVEYHVNRLIEQHLLTGRHPSDPYSINKANGGLTDLGVRFCENIDKYERLKTELGI